MMSMAVMIMRSKVQTESHSLLFGHVLIIQYIAWMSFLISLSAFFRDRPSMSTKTGRSPWMAIAISCSSLIVVYLYYFFLLYILMSGQFCFLHHPAVPLENLPPPRELLPPEHIRLQIYQSCIGIKTLWKYPLLY